ncbi:MAG TPA: DUF1289 domain-containing protein [Methyloversatilis sp.]
MIASPCTGVCRLNPVSALCEGCLRSGDEIACWGSTTDQHRARILERIFEREDAGHVRVAPGEKS